MGVGRGKGEDRVQQAVQAAIDSPLLETSIDGAKAILLNVMGGYDLGMLEVNEAADKVQSAADQDVILIFGASIKEELKDEMIVTVIATGFDSGVIPSDYIAGVGNKGSLLSGSSIERDDFNLDERAVAPPARAPAYDPELDEPEVDPAALESEEDNRSIEEEIDSKAANSFVIPSFLQNKK